MRAPHYYNKLPRGKQPVLTHRPLPLMPEEKFPGIRNGPDAAASGLFRRLAGLFSRKAGESIPAGNKASIRKQPLIHVFKRLCFPLIIIIAFYLFSKINVSGSGEAVLSGVTSSISDTAENLKGFVRFIGSLKTLFGFLTGIIGFRAIILFIFASLIGIGLSFFGVSKGKYSFFFSLFIADVFWFLWIKSFSIDPSGLFNDIIMILKTNLILIIPFAVVYIIKKPFISKKALSKIAVFLKLPHTRRRSLKKENAVLLSERLSEISTRLQASLIRDILNRENKNKVVLSGDTIKNKKELEDALSKLRE